MLVVVVMAGASEAHLEKDDTKVVRGKIVTRISKCARPGSDGSDVGDFPCERDARSNGVAYDAREVQTIRCDARHNESKEEFSTTTGLWQGAGALETVESSIERPLATVPRRDRK